MNKVLRGPRTIHRTHEKCQHNCDDICLSSINQDLNGYSPSNNLFVSCWLVGAPPGSRHTPSPHPEVGRSAAMLGIRIYPSEVIKSAAMLGIRIYPSEVVKSAAMLRIRMYSSEVVSRHVGNQNVFVRSSQQAC